MTQKRLDFIRKASPVIIGILFLLTMTAVQSKITKLENIQNQNIQK